MSTEQPRECPKFLTTLAAVLQISLRSCLQNSRESFKFVEYPRGSYVDKSGVGAAIVYRTAARMSESDKFTQSSFKFVQYCRGSYVDKSGVVAAIAYRTAARISEFSDTRNCSADKSAQLSTEQPREFQSC